MYASTKPPIDFQAYATLPPHNVEAEAAILGAILSDQNAIARVITTLTAKHFYVGRHGQIYGAMVTLHQFQMPTDLVTVAQWLSDRDLLEQCGGQPQLVTLLDSCVTSVNIDHYAELVIEKANRRRAIAIADELKNAAYQTDTPFLELLEKIQSGVFELSGAGDRTNRGAMLSELMVAVNSEIEERFESGRAIGIRSGFYDLDAMTSGFQDGDLIIPAGRPSMGKTSWMLNAAQSMAADGNPGIFFSLEMSKEQLAYRLLSTQAKIENGRLRSGRIQDFEWKSLASGIGILSGLPIAIDDSPSPSVEDMRAKCLGIAAQMGGIRWVAIDYLQLMQGSSGNRVQDLSVMTRRLKGLARELNCPVFALSQLSRGVESRTNKRPMMSDLRESGSIEQDADLILMFYRDEYYNPDTPDRGLAEVIITKHRNGPVGTVKLLFDAPFTEFKNLAKPGGRIA